MYGNGRDWRDKRYSSNNNKVQLSTLSIAHSEYLEDNSITSLSVYKEGNIFNFSCKGTWSEEIIFETSKL